MNADQLDNVVVLGKRQAWKDKELVWKLTTKDCHEIFRGEDLFHLQPTVVQNNTEKIAI